MKFMRKYLLSLLLIVTLSSGAYAAADLGNTAVISPTDASNGSGTCPSWLGSAAPSTLDDSGRCIQGAVAREWENRSYPTSTGTAPAFVVTYTVAPIALRSGQTYTFTAHAAAVGTDTLNANAFGAKGIKKVVAGVKTATAANDFYTGDKIAVVYDGTDMVWVNTVSTSTLVVGPASATDNAIARFDGTGGKTVQNSVATIGDTGNLTIAGTATGTYTLQGTGAHSTLVLERTDTHGDVAHTGSIQFKGRDSAGAAQVYGEIFGGLAELDNAGAEDAQTVFQTVISGTQATRMVIRNGVYVGAATGGDRGAGTINASAIYDDGVLLTAPVVIPKAADQAVASATLTNDTHFTFALAANTKYEGEIILDTNHGSASDFQFDITGPAAPNSVRYFVKSAIEKSGVGTNNNLAGVTSSAFSTAISVLTDASGGMNITIGFYIDNGANAGTFQFRWANNAGTTSNSVLDQSWMKYQVVN